MKLSQEAYRDYLAIHHSMLLYAGKKVLGVHREVKDLAGFDLEEIVNLREALYHTPGLIEEYVRKNPDGFSEEWLNDARGFKDFVDGEFFIVKYLKKHTVFLLASEETSIAYGVLSLETPIKELSQGEYPILVDAVLLPFRGKIVYDGIILFSPVSFGSKYKKMINHGYSQAKISHGLVTTLPFDPASSPEVSPESLLDFYMKNARNRDIYEWEIEKLLEEHPELEGQYEYNWGKVFSREKKENLKSLGISGLHYAIINDTIIAQGESSFQVKEMVKAILPKSKHSWVYYFSV